LSQVNEPLREMISAVVDGEASEFEYRRVLESVDDAGVAALLGRHYAVRAVARREAQALCPPALTASILAALAAQAPAAAAPRWRMPVGGVAVAASVCMAAVFGLRALAPEPAGMAQTAVVASGAASLGELGRPGGLPVPVAGPAVPVGFVSALPAPGSAMQHAGASPDQLAEQRLRLFMVDHVQNAALNTNVGMLPYARVVSYEAP
jgi:sigma-E factor negative regulatory protein RseA